MARRYEGLGRVCKAINPPNDLNAFIKSLNIPETLNVSKHNYSIPQGAKDIPPHQMAQVPKKNAAVARSQEQACFSREIRLSPSLFVFNGSQKQGGRKEEIRLYRGREAERLAGGAPRCFLPFIHFRRVVDPIFRIQRVHTSDPAAMYTYIYIQAAQHTNTLMPLLPPTPSR